MFYAHFVLSKKGPLARVWLAAHWDKKLTKAHVFETNIESSVDDIIQPKVKMALRTSGHLLLGVVRIYSRKAKYLLADCNEAFVKIKMAFRPGVVDLPEENREAAVATITLPETFHDFETTMADLSDIDVQAQFSVNQSRPEEITMREDLGNITLVGDDGFGDMGFDDRTIIQDAHMDDTLYKNPDSSNILLDNTVEKGGNQEKPMDIDFDAPPRDDGFGDGLDEFAIITFAKHAAEEAQTGENFMGEAGGLFEEPPVPEVLPEAEAAQPAQKEGEQPPKLGPQEEEAGPAPQEQTTVPDQTTLVPNEAEAFALEPLDVTSIGTERKAKRKRKLVVDEQKGIASETMKLQLSDTSEIVTTLDLAPPTKKLMHWKETGGVEKLFALPGRSMASKRIGRFFNKNLITRPIADEEDPGEEKLDLEAEERARQEEEFKRASMSHVEQPSVLEEHSRLQESSIAAPPPPPPMPAAQETSLLTRPAEESTSVIEPELSAMDSTLQAPDADADFQNHLDPDMEDNDDIFMDLPMESELAAEQQNGEVEAGELEERRWNKRTQHLMFVMNRTLDTEDSLSFSSLISRNNRKQVASKFYTLLVLKKQQAVEVEQSEPYGDIIISKGPRAEMVY